MALNLSRNTQVFISTVNGVHVNGGGAIEVDTITAGTGHAVNDVITCGTGATAVSVIVTSVNGSGGVTGITLANKTSSGVTASVFLDNFSGSNDVNIVKDATIPAGSSLEVMAGNKLVVQNNGSAGDVIRVSSNTATAIDATISVLEDV